MSDGIAKITNLVTTQALLPAVGVFPIGVFLGDIFEAAQPIESKLQDGYTLIEGFINSDVNGTLDVYQGTFADMQAVGVAPGVGVSDGIKNLNTFGHVGAAASPGTNVACPLVGPFVRCRYTNGAAPQTVFRLQLKAAE